MRKPNRPRGAVLRIALQSLVDGPKFLSEMVAATGETSSLLCLTMRAATKSGRVTAEMAGPKHNRYELTDKGRAYLADPDAHKTLRPWPQDKLDFLLAHHGQPGWTYERIGKQIGFTKSAVQRQVAKMGLIGVVVRPVFWTPERVEKLREGYALGLGVPEIADACRSTPSAVTTKAYTLGISKANVRTSRPAVERSWLKASPIYEVPSTARPWLEREFGQCAFPVCGDGADVWSCCGPVTSGSYCDGHKAVMFRVSEGEGQARAA